MHTSKGKKRAIEVDPDDSSSLSSVPSDERPKKSHRVERRNCPICDELVPVRLLGKHALLEAERVEEIMRHIGSVEIIGLQDDEFEEGSSTTRSRRSAAKARISMKKETVDNTEKTIQTIRRHRKQRHARLRETTREDTEEDFALLSQTVCPVCSIPIYGDEDVLNAHIDSCLAGEASRVEQQQRAEKEAIVDIDDNVGASNLDDIDVDDEVDIDGDDKFGETQFTEGDIIESGVQVDEEFNIRGLISERKNLSNSLPAPASIQAAEYDKLEQDITIARRSCDPNALLTALETKVKHLENARSSFSCRICLDPYTEPTASTGCWHTFCKDCWLTCLGTTKLCPICKRITGVSELRRVYI